MAIIDKEKATKWNYEVDKSMKPPPVNYVVDYKNQASVAT